MRLLQSRVIALMITTAVIHGRGGDSGSVPDGSERRALPYKSPEEENIN
jgi:hypothetical protein